MKESSHQCERHAVEPALLTPGLGYLQNHSVAARRHPQAMMYGTTRNEAYHQQLKTFYRNIFVQTGRNACLVAKLATTAKLLAANVSASSGMEDREHQILNSAAESIMASNVTVRPRLRCHDVPNPVVDLTSLPKSAKTCRKRPASSQPAMRRRPSGSR